MAKIMPTTFFYITLLLCALVLTSHCNEVQREVHVVYMGEMPKGVASMASVHLSMLGEVLGRSSTAKESLVYSYGRSFNGFAAKLTKEEATIIKEMEGVASVLPNKIYNLHTTRSWDFMGMTTSRTIRYPLEGDVIIGLIDTGIWPESASFGDEGMGPHPARWKGICESTNITCNNKIIGARFYNSEHERLSPTDFNSPRDSEGHGSHTSSTVAGVEVPNTSFFGLANGTAHGGVPGARIAMYKACWSFGCPLADILAAFDDAIADGVDILSVSLGGDPESYFQDPIAIGSFHAMKKGILTVNSAGNGGSDPRSIANVAPWTITVAASTIDRRFVTEVVLGNGKHLIGNSINRFTFYGSAIPLIYGGDAINVSAGAGFEASRYCSPGSLDSNKVKNSIVLCDYVTRGNSILMAEGFGVVMSDTEDPYLEDRDVAFSFPLPATVINVEDRDTILDYIKSTSNPIVTMLAGETIYNTIAPRVANFSSRGPNVLDLDILKPDLTAPGVDILAAWSSVASPSVSDTDPTRTNYNVISGTSMSCPHVSGAAAYIKSAHPNWSPAAIKSALMTTANVMDPRKNADAEFAYGAGHINPIKALNPGLVFDASEYNYINFLCAQGYNTTTLRLLTGDSSACPSINKTDEYARNLNYPSFGLAVVDKHPIQGVFHRTVTNVGAANSTYYAVIYETADFSVEVYPSRLSFASVGETKSFTVTLSGGAISQKAIISGSIEWKDGTHVVRTPIAIYTVLSRQTPLEVEF